MTKMPPKTQSSTIKSHGGRTASGVALNPEVVSIMRPFRGCCCRGCLRGGASARPLVEREGLRLDPLGYGIDSKKDLKSLKALTLTNQVPFKTIYLMEFNGYIQSGNPLENC